MLASGNGELTVCVDNLMAMRRGECAYNRVKGLDQDIIDMTMEDAELELMEDADFVIEQFEPRASLDDIEMEINEEDGGLSVQIVLIDMDSELYDDVEIDEE